MCLSDVSEGAGNFLPDFRHLNVALAAIIGERHLTALCKAQDLVLALDECIEQFFRLGFGNAVLSAFFEVRAVARTYLLEA